MKPTHFVRVRHSTWGRDKDPPRELFCPNEWLKGTDLVYFLLFYLHYQNFKEVSLNDIKLFEFNGLSEFVWIKYEEQ